MSELEEMSSFFDRRVDNYEKHMLESVTDSNEFYTETARLVPKREDLNLLDLGCGTGLELDEILKLNPTINVTGIDLSSKMLERLKSKNIDKADQLTLINGSYFDVDFGMEKFDSALSVQTMHRFTHEQKVTLYKKIYYCLSSDGFYIETDYIANSQKDEDFFFAESRRLRLELGLNHGFYHFDTPCTVENQTKLLKSAGFNEVNLHRQYKNTAIFMAKKI